MNKLFLFKDIKLEQEEDRDCLMYISTTPSSFVCEHYFSNLSLGNASSGGEAIDKIEFENIKTFLTEREFEKLKTFSKEISELGFGITKGDERYNKGEELISNIQPIFDKLNSKAAIDFQNKIIAEEIEYIKEEYNIEEDEIKAIFELTSYKDRSFISSIYEDIEDLAYEEAFSLGYATKENERWFDFETFGEELLEDENYYELSDGRVVLLAC